MLNQEHMPGAGSVADTIAFMKQLWSGVGAPSMAMPSLSVEDINRKIADLKTVASWLELNLNMLKATIQTLEVQSATLSTLQAMGAIMASPPPADHAAADGVAAAAPFPFGFPMWGDKPAADASEAAAAEVSQAAAEPVPDMPEDTPPADGAAAPMPDFQSAMANPNAWWNVLQEQFKHAVDNVMAGVQAEPPAEGKPSRAARTGVRREKQTVGKAAPAARAKPVPKAAPKRAAKGKMATVAAKKSVSVKAVAANANKNQKNTSAPARSGVVQSRPDKKPASRKPSSP